jgi:hypothetical protein
MRTIVNKTTRPLRVPLGGGKTLFLGPAKSGQVADSAVDHPGLRKLIDAGDVQVQGAGADGVTVEGGGNEAGHSDVHGKQRGTNVHRRGGQRGA